MFSEEQNGMIDYRRGGASATQGYTGDPEVSEKRSIRSNRSKRSHRKQYEDMDHGDLEKQMKDEQERPLGALVGDWQAKGRGVDDGAYIGPGEPTHEKPQRRQFDDDGQDIATYPRQDMEDDYYGGLAPRGASRGGFVAEEGHPEELGYDPEDRNFLHDHNPPNYGTPTLVSQVMLMISQATSFGLTTLNFNLLVVIAIATFVFKRASPFSHAPPRAKVEKEWSERISGERFSSRAEYYANFFGYECEDVDIETEDGFVLRAHHLTSRKHKKLGHPVILQHGILSNSVTWMVNEERSLAFWLLEQGYDVYVTNIRTNFEMPHRHFSRSDPRYWAWAIKEIGIYDLPAIIDYVYKRTGLKPAYIGHSQGTGTMFLGLSRGMRPDMGNKMSCFIALGPSVYAGPVLRTFPFSLMRQFRARSLWKFIFGIREFVPIIGIFQDILPSWLFGHVAFPVFAFMFGFHDHNWVPRQIPKFFRTVAVPTSSELLYYYMANFSYNNCIFHTETDEPWFPKSFPPLAVYYGTIDTLVIGKPLVERIRSYESNVRLVKTVALENYEHLDMLWGVSAVNDCFFSIRDMIEETKGGFPRIEDFHEAPRRSRSRRSSRSHRESRRSRSIRDEGYVHSEGY